MIRRLGYSLLVVGFALIVAGCGSEQNTAPTNTTEINKIEKRGEIKEKKKVPVGGRATVEMEGPPNTNDRPPNK